MAFSDRVCGLFCSTWSIITAIACFKVSGATIGGGVRLGLRIGVVEPLSSPESSSSESSEMILIFFFDGGRGFLAALRVKCRIERTTVV